MNENINLLYKKLHEATIKGEIEAILHAGYKVLKLPLAVTDMSLRVLGPGYYPKGNVGAPHWDKPQKQQYVPLDIVEMFRRENMFSSVMRNPDKSFYLDWGSLRQAPCLSTLIQIDNQPEGLLAAYCPRDKLQDWHFDALPILANSIAVVLKMQGLARGSSGTLKETFMINLLNGNIDQPALDHWKNLLNMTIKPAFTLLSLSDVSQDPADLRVYVREHFFGRYHFAHTTLYKDSLVVILQNMSSGTDFHVILDDLEVALTNLSTKVGISSLYENLLDTPSHYQQATLAVEIGAQIHPDKTRFHFEDFRLESLLRSPLRPGRDHLFIHPAILVLADYDTNQRTELLPTLRRYISSGYSKTICAKELHIHRNTLDYRLQRIEELCGPILSHPRDLLEISIGLILHDQTY